MRKPEGERQAFALSRKGRSKSMCDDDGSGNWGKKAFLVVVGFAVPLVWWLLNRKEEATEGAPRQPAPAPTPSPAPPPPPTGVSLEPMGTPGKPVLEAVKPTEAPAQKEPEADATAVPAAVSNPSVEMNKPAAPEVAVEGAAVPAKVDPPPPPPTSAPEPASSATAPAKEVSPAEPSFESGFPVDIEISDADGKHFSAHLLSLNLKTARLRCEREMRSSEKLVLILKSRSGDTLTPTATVSKIDGEEVDLKLMRLNEGLKKRVQAFLDEQSAG